MRAGRFFVKVLLVVLIGAAVALAGVGGWWKQAKQPVGPGPAQRVTVPKGASVQSVGRLLQSKNLIREPNAFAILGRGKSVRAGTYDIAPSETPATILDRLVRGDVVEIPMVKVAIPEGFTLRQIAARLEEKGLGKADEYLSLTETQGKTFEASKPLPAKLEGYLFPATYEFPQGALPRAVVQKMVGTFDDRVADKFDQVAKVGRPLGEVVTIASMIEREARVPQDRTKISGVIYNRLAKGMPLQIDATVQYAQGEHKTRLLYRDLKVDSPYNTYKVRGLPPGPICSPGEASLDAALTPEKSDFLYYVAKPDGSHLFGRTMAEHQRNIALVRSGRADAPAPAPRPNVAAAAVGTAAAVGAVRTAAAVRRPAAAVRRRATAPRRRTARAPRRPAARPRPAR